jgi:hypothetical protein
MEHDIHLTQYHEEWSKIFAQESDPNGYSNSFFPRGRDSEMPCCPLDRSSAFRCTLLPL